MDCAFDEVAFDAVAFDVCETSAGNYVQRVISRSVVFPVDDIEELRRKARQRREEEEIIIL